MDFEVVEQSAVFSNGKTIVQEEAIAQFKTLGRAFDYCEACNKHERNIFYVREK